MPLGTFAFIATPGPLRSVEAISHHPGSDRSTTVTVTDRPTRKSTSQTSAKAPDAADAIAAADPIDELVSRATVALAEYARFTQEDVDRLVKKGSVAAL